MKIAFQLLFCLTGKIYHICSLVFTFEIFSQLDGMYFGKVLGGKILQKTNSKMAGTNLKKKLLNSVTLILKLEKVLHLLEIKRGKGRE